MLFLFWLFSSIKKCAILKSIKGDKMKKLEQGFQKIIFMEIVYAVVFAIIGLIIALNSEMTNKVVGLLMGTFLLVLGILNFFSFIDKNKIKLFSYNFIFGILNIILGMFVMFNPLSIVNFLNITLGIWFIIESVNKIVYFIYLKKVGEESSKVVLVSSILFLLLGILIIINPFRSIVITRTVGIFIILCNILNLNDLVLLRKRSKNFLKLFK